MRRGGKDKKRKRNADGRFGWSGAYPEVHWFVPIFFTSFFGMSALARIGQMLTERYRSFHPVPNDLCLLVRFISRRIRFCIHSQRLVQIIVRSVRLVLCFVLSVDRRELADDIVDSLYSLMRYSASWVLEVETLYWVVLHVCLSRLHSCSSNSTSRVFIPLLV